MQTVDIKAVFLVILILFQMYILGIGFRRNVVDEGIYVMTLITIVVSMLSTVFYWFTYVLGMNMIIFSVFVPYGFLLHIVYKRYKTQQMVSHKDELIANIFYRL